MATLISSHTFEIKIAWEGLEVEICNSVVTTFLANEDSLGMYDVPKSIAVSWWTRRSVFFHLKKRLMTHMSIRYWHHKLKSVEIGTMKFIRFHIRFIRKGVTKISKTDKKLENFQLKRWEFWYRKIF